MKLDRCLKLCAFIVLMLCICSACISAVILSSETLNAEPTITTEPEYVKAEIVVPSDTINKLSDSHTNTDRTNVNSGEISKSDISAQDIELNLDKIAYTDTKPSNKLDKPIEANLDREVPPEKSVEDKVSSIVETPTPITEDASKDILIEPAIIADIKNAIEDSRNDSVLLQPLPTTEDATRQNDSSTEATSININKTESENVAIEKDQLNLTVDENQIPVFSEWAQKRLEEVEKEVEQEAVNTSSMKRNAPAASKPPVLKLKNSKNYASPDCGAKIVAANSESSGTGYVLTSTKDEYLLSPCKSRIWFVVELCEAIQAERIDLANFELFSSSPKNFSVGVANRFPTRDWTNVGKFIANDERYIQNFDLQPHMFGKYVRVDVHSHYNSEHFCPISLFRVYGTSEFEAFETENRQHPLDDIDDDDEDDQESDVARGKSNIFKSASDAVMSIVDTVKKAASFVKHNGNKTNESQSASIPSPSSVNCITPNHVISCENCSNDMTRQVTALIECKQQLLNRLLSIDLIRNSIHKSQICKSLIGSDLNINCSEPTHVNVTTSKLTGIQIDYINHLFSLEYVTAMCNLLAAADRKIGWNSTVAINTEPPVNVTIDQKADNQLLSHESVKHKPAVQIEHSEPTSTSQNSSDEIKQAEQVNIATESTENRIEIDTTEKQTVTSPGDAIESIVDIPNIENKEIADENGGQNIFNVVESEDKNGENPPTENLIETTTERASMEQETPPGIIILPEVKIPTNDPIDAIDDPVSNGWTNTPQFGQKFHSDSVFLRLSNRVKALERNMSLSGQYLEELSRRYKKQVEELQQTVSNIEEQIRKNTERKQELYEQNQQLRNEIDILTERIFSWKNILICCVCFTCVQIVIFHLILKIWGRKYGLVHEHINVSESDVNVDMDRKRKSGNVPMKFRRKSAEEKRARNPSDTSSLQRRPSADALNITGTYTELLIDGANRESNDDTKCTHYNKSTSCDSHETDISGYVKIEDLKELYDKPEEEYEFYGPVAELRTHEINSQTEDCSESIDSSIDSFSSHPKKTKAIRNKNKHRRLSSPSFFKSPFSSGSAAQSTGWEWHRTKKTSNSSQINYKKSKSESPPKLKQNGSINNNSMPAILSNEKNTTQNDSVRSFGSTDERKSGSFKRILKKIF